MTKRQRREFVPDDLVLLRMPGLVSKMDETWTAWQVVRKCGPVTYEQGKEITHLNSMKKYLERDREVNRSLVLAEP